mmetsp:Transcript_32789/g.89806  ORF Transcript_32789/g.89806 Transcript_32789/m.89806 type:complete len:362 (+) Transcript_32789:1817-2902(+)
MHLEALCDAGVPARVASGRHVCQPGQVLDALLLRAARLVHGKALLHQVHDGVLGLGVAIGLGLWQRSAYLRQNGSPQRMGAHERGASLPKWEGGARPLGKVEVLGQRSDHCRRDRDVATRPISHPSDAAAAPVMEVAVLAVAGRQHGDAGAQRLRVPILRPRLLAQPVGARPRLVVGIILVRLDTPPLESGSDLLVDELLLCHPRGGGRIEFAASRLLHALPEALQLLHDEEGTKRRAFRRGSLPSGLQSSFGLGRFGSGEAAGVLFLDESQQHLSCSLVRGYRGALGEVDVRLLLFLLRMNASAPHVDVNSADAVVVFHLETHPSVDDGERLEPIERGVEQRNVTAALSRQHALSLRHAC